MSTLENSIYKEQSDEIFPSGISIFACILLFFFFFFYLKMYFQGEYLRILLSLRSSDIKTNPGPKETILLQAF